MKHDTGPDPNTRNFAASRGTRFTIGSLCTGTGGLDLAVEQTSGGEMLWCAEYDKHASRIIEKRFGVPNYGDLNVVDPHTLPPVDIITAGFPCQPVSVAGKRLGAADHRYIWPRIATVIEQIQPKAVVLENVVGLLSKGFSVVLQNLSDMGFDAEWGVVPAAAAGAPHRRDRVFVFAWPADRYVKSDPVGLPSGPQTQRSAARQRELPLPGASGGNDPRWTDHGGGYCDRLRAWEGIVGAAPWPVTANGDGKAGIRPEFAEWLMGLPSGWVTDPALGLTAPQQWKLLGNAVVPQAATLAVTELARRACIAVGIPTAA